jgi:hypothetical protein
LPLYVNCLSTRQLISQVLVVCACAHPLHWASAIFHAACRYSCLVLWRGSVYCTTVVPRAPACAVSAEIAPKTASTPIASPRLVFDLKLLAFMLKNNLRFKGRVIVQCTFGCMPNKILSTRPNSNAVALVVHIRTNMNLEFEHEECFLKYQGSASIFFMCQTPQPEKVSDLTLTPCRSTRDLCDCLPMREMLHGHARLRYGGAFGGPHPYNPGFRI